MEWDRKGKRAFRSGSGLDNFMAGRSPAKEKDTNYISPKQFTADLREYYDAAEAEEKLDPEDKSPEARQIRRRAKKALDVCRVTLYKMVRGLANNGKFSGYTWRDEMISDALAKRTRALVGRKFDFSLACNPFSYFNRILWREFVRRIKLEKKYVDTKIKYSLEHYTDFAEATDTPIYVKKRYDPNEDDYDGLMFHDEDND